MLVMRTSDALQFYSRSGHACCGVTADQREEGTEGDRRQGGMAKEMKRRSRNMEDRTVQEMLREDF
jgi:hypothetical protein